MSAPDAVAVQEMWASYVGATGHDGPLQGAFAFGNSAQLADELGGLVLHGPKCATAGLVVDYVRDAEPLPVVGEHSIVVDGSGRPLCVVRTVDVRLGPLSSVDEAFAWDEGEGDRSLAYWWDAHVGFFTRRCATLGVHFTEDIEVCFERFETVWPADPA